MDDRQRSALGAIANARLRNLCVAIVGLGGTGSPLAEELARMGVKKLVLIDPDVVDDPSNLRRVVGSTPADLEQTVSKVDVVARHLEKLGLGLRIRKVPLDVRQEAAARHLVDADIAVITTDTQSSRALVNQMAFQYWIPVIDVGVRVGTSVSGAITGMPAEIRVLLPDAGCLWCRDVLDADAIRAENLPPDERVRLAAEGYIQGLPGPQPSLTPLNYCAASLAALIILRLLSGQPVVSHSFIADPWELYMQFLNESVRPDCLCQQWRGRADSHPISFLP
jgi:hypothetical protein